MQSITEDLMVYNPSFQNYPKGGDMKKQEKKRLRDLSGSELRKKLNRLEKRGLEDSRRAKYIKYQLKKKA